MDSGYVVWCHPLRESFTARVADHVARSLEVIGVAVDLVDLYRETFDPRLTADEYARRFSFAPFVQRQGELLEGASRIAVIHPDWWGAPPALLKGWVDRVFRPGIAYEYEGEEFMEKKRVPLLSGKRAIVFTTSDLPPYADESPIARFWRLVFGYCGIEHFDCHSLYDFRSVDGGARAAWIDSVGEKIKAWSA